MSKQFGSIYLILGTCIAAGMLGLPIVTAEYHFALTALMLISSWLLMTFGAWCLLQVNMSMPAGANFISMSQATLGRAAKYITWIAYLMLLYSLICAYLAASGDLLQALLHHTNIIISRPVATLIAAFLLGGIVYLGIHSVDITNRFLMSTKFIICVLLIASVLPFTHTSQLSQGDWHLNHDAWLVIITSFGYGSILPSIRDYLDNDRKKIMRVFFISSIIPITLYFIWIAVIQGALPRFGAHGLVAMNNSANTNSLLMNAIAALTHFTLIKSISIAFISICSITGFLSVTTSLFDALTDGLERTKKGMDRVLIALLALLPPALIVIFDPTIFTRALAYAGFCCLYILVVLPISMYVSQRLKRGV
jgi:tyrosine-specific transport protein